MRRNEAERVGPETLVPPAGSRKRGLAVRPGALLLALSGCSPLGCTAIVNADEFRMAPPEARDGGIFIPGETPITVTPARIDEGIGTGSASPGVLTLAGPPRFSSEEARALDEGLEVVGVARSLDGARLGVAVRATVDPSLGEGEVRLVRLEVPGLGLSQVEVVGHDEGQLRGIVETAELPAGYARLELLEVRFVGRAPADLVVFGDVDLVGPVLVAANGPIPGPGGCLDRCATVGAPGGAGNRGSGGGGGGSYGGAGRRGDGSEGGAGGVSAGEVGDSGGSPGSGGPGGPGDGDTGGLSGGAGGLFWLDARGPIRGSGVVDASGADGASAPGCRGGGGGGGGGGGVVLASSTGLDPGSAPLVAGGVGGGGRACGGKGGDGAIGRHLRLGPGAGSNGLIEPSDFADARVVVRGEPEGALRVALGDAEPFEVVLDGLGQAEILLEASGTACLVDPLRGRRLACVERFVR